MDTQASVTGTLKRAMLDGHPRIVDYTNLKGHD